MVERIFTPEAPQSAAPISQATRVGNLYFLSGQTPVDPKTGKLAGSTITEQATRVMENIGAILRSQNLGFEDVAKATCYMRRCSWLQCCFCQVFHRLPSAFLLRGAGTSQEVPMRGRSYRCSKMNKAPHAIGCEGADPMSAKTRIGQGCCVHPACASLCAE